MIRNESSVVKLEGSVGTDNPFATDDKPIPAYLPSSPSKGLMTSETKVKTSQERMLYDGNAQISTNMKHKALQSNAKITKTPELGKVLSMHKNAVMIEKKSNSPAPFPLDMEQDD